MQRVMIIGQPGSGKSTFARRLGAITWLPVFYMDHIHWKSGWQERSRDEKTKLCHEVHLKDRWIFEGGHSVTWDERLARSDTLIWLDVGLPTRLQRVVRRTLRHYGQSRPDLPEGCPEHFNWEFYSFIWRTRHTARRKIAALVADAPSDKSVQHLRTKQDMARYLSDVKRAMQSGALGLPHR